MLYPFTYIFFCFITICRTHVFRVCYHHFPKFYRFKAVYRVFISNAFLLFIRRTFFPFDKQKTFSLLRYMYLLIFVILIASIQIKIFYKIHTVILQSHDRRVFIFHKNRDRKFVSSPYNIFHSTREKKISLVIILCLLILNKIIKQFLKVLPLVIITHASQI